MHVPEHYYYYSYRYFDIIIIIINNFLPQGTTEFAKYFKQLFKIL